MPDCCVAGGLLNKLPNPPACAGGCDGDVPNADVDAGLDPPRVLPNNPPPSPPVLAGCAGCDVPPPRLPNKPDVVPVPDCVFVFAPKRLLDAGVPDVGTPEVPGCWPPRLPKSDMFVVVRVRGC